MATRSTRGRKTAAQARPAARRRSRRAAAEKAIRVRMYRQGFGDCLLVDLPGSDGKPFRMMIDCGVLWGTPDAVPRMRAVVEDLVEETGGRVDVLVVTHEHWDHVSGFSQAREMFAVEGAQARPGQLAVGEVWLAWTEDPSDPLARQLREEQKAKLNALLGLTGALGAEASPASGPLAAGISGLLGFFALSATATGDALEVAKSLGPNRYLRPSDRPWQDERVPGIRIFVLGPPPDAKMLRQLVRARELYHGFGDTALADAFLVALDEHLGIDADRDAELRRELYYPFDGVFRLPLSRAGFDAEAQRIHPADELEALHAHLEANYWDDAWRRIDSDWLGGAAELALHLDAATNNTSLVLAIEIVATGKVLLLVGDAQVGNWLSWHDLKWTLDDRQEVTGPDLLARTVFYKVGHHGSHNATLKDKGLEMMSRDDFVAFVPVDEDTAISRNWNRIPLRTLMEALSSRGVAVRSDLGLPDRPGLAPGRLTQTDLFVEYRLPI